jgi:hypothetical protein
MIRYSHHQCIIYMDYQGFRWARDSVVGWGTLLQAGSSRVPFPMWSLDYFNLLNLSSRIMTLGYIQPLTEMSTRNLPGELRAASA